MGAIVKMVVNVDLTEKDFIHANIDFMHRSLSKILSISVIAFIVIIGYQFFISSENSGYLSFFLLMVFLLLALIPIIALGWLVLTRLAIPLAVRWDLRTALGKMSATSYEIDEDSIKSIAVAGYSHLKWGDFKFYSETKTHILIYISHRIFLIFPKRYLNQEQCNFILNLLNIHNIKPRGMF